MELCHTIYQKYPQTLSISQHIKESCVCILSNHHSQNISSFFCIKPSPTIPIYFTSAWEERGGALIGIVDLKRFSSHFSIILGAVPKLRTQNVVVKCTRFSALVETLFSSESSWTPKAQPMLLFGWVFVVQLGLRQTRALINTYFITIF